MGKCRRCHNEYMRDWNKKNPGAAAAATKKWHIKNPKAPKPPKAPTVMSFPVVASAGKSLSALSGIDAKREKKRTAGRADYSKNRERYLVRAKERATIKAAEVSQYQREWRRRNAAKKAASDRNWRQANAHKVSVYAGSRNMRERQSMPLWLTAIQLAQMQEFYEIAVARTVQTGIEHHVDHIHPLKGIGFSGLHVPWNLQVMIGAENQSKGRRLPLAG